MIRFNHVWAGKIKGRPPLYLLNDMTHDFLPGYHTGILCVNKPALACLQQVLCGTLYPQQGEIIRTMSVSWPIGSLRVFDPNLTGLENIRFLARIYGTPTAHIRDFVADFTGLEQLFTEKFGRYDSHAKEAFAFAVPFAFSFDFYLGMNYMVAGEKAFHKRCSALIDYMMKQHTFIVMASNSKPLKRFAGNVYVLDNGMFTKQT